MRVTKSLITIGLCAAALPAAAGRTGPIEVGEPFPDLRLPTLEDGRLRSIADFRGERLVLHVFASW